MGSLTFPFLVNARRVLRAAGEDEAVLHCWRPPCQRRPGVLPCPALAGFPSMLRAPGERPGSRAPVRLAVEPKSGLRRHAPVARTPRLPRSDPGHGAQRLPCSARGAPAPRSCLRVLRRLMTLQRRRRVVSARAHLNRSPGGGGFLLTGSSLSPLTGLEGFQPPRYFTRREVSGATR